MPRKKKNTLRLPLIPLRGLMVFPHMVLHFDVGRARSVAALEQAMMEDQQVFLVAQSDGDVEEPTMDELCRVGTVAAIKQVLNLPGDTIRVLVEGEQRAFLRAITQEDPYWIADVEVPTQELPDTPETEAMVRSTHDLFEEYARASMRVSGETLRSVSEVDRPDQLADIIAANVLTRVEDRQAILEEIDVEKFMELLRDYYLQKLPDAVLYELTEADKAAIKKLADEKYSTWGWNYGASPAFAVTASRKFDFGLVDVRLNVRRGRIKDIRIFGDYFGMKSISEIEERLEGVEYRREAIAEVLQNFDLGEYISGMTAEELNRLIVNS